MGMQKVPVSRPIIIPGANMTAGNIKILFSAIQNFSPASNCWGTFSTWFLGVASVTGYCFCSASDALSEEIA